MTKRFEFNWQIPVPEPLLAGCVFDRWTEEKDNTDLEIACTFKVDEYGFFIYWKSEGRVRCLFNWKIRTHERRKENEREIVLVIVSKSVHRFV